MTKRVLVFGKAKRAGAGGSPVRVGKQGKSLLSSQDKKRCRMSSSGRYSAVIGNHITSVKQNLPESAWKRMNVTGGLEAAGFVLLQDKAFFARLSRVKALRTAPRACTKGRGNRALTSNANEESRRLSESAQKKPESKL